MIINYQTETETEAPESPAQSLLPENGEWAIIEFFGHRRTAGWVSECQRFGATMGRVDIPDGDSNGVYNSSEGGSKPRYKTQLFNGNSIYCFTPCSEEAARAIAARSDSMPVSPWEMRNLLAAPDDHDEPDDEPEFERDLFEDEGEEES